MRGANCGGCCTVERVAYLGLSVVPSAGHCSAAVLGTVTMPVSRRRVAAFVRGIDWTRNKSVRHSFVVVWAEQHYALLSC